MTDGIDRLLVETANHYLGETIGFWIQTGAFLISAAGGIWIVGSRERSERRRATIDLIIQQKLDRILIDAKNTVLRLHEDGEDNFAQFLEDPNSDEYKSIMTVLNNHEFISTGVREGALSEKMLKRAQYSMVLRDWDALCPVIMTFRRRTGFNTLFQEFERLAKRWKAKPLKVETHN